MNHMNDYNEAVNRLKGCIKHYTDRFPWSASSDAPDTYKKMVASYYQNNKEVIVWDGASETAIWGSDYNVMFRAWHDFNHIQLQADFSVIGETQVLCKQQQQYIQWRKSSLAQPAMDNIDVIALELLRIEILGQRYYYEAGHGYVEDQTKFAKNILASQLGLCENYIN